MNRGDSNCLSQVALPPNFPKTSFNAKQTIAGVTETVDKRHMADSRHDKKKLFIGAIWDDIHKLLITC